MEDPRAEQIYFDALEMGYINNPCKTCRLEFARISSYQEPMLSKEVIERMDKARFMWALVQNISYISYGAPNVSRNVNLLLEELSKRLGGNSNGREDSRDV